MIQAVKTARIWGAMIKFSHSIFALPFAIFATFLAARPALPHWGQFTLIILCMVAARSAAMTFNRIVDARFDALNPRTRLRAIPSGHISISAAWMFFAAAALAFLIGCVGFWWWFANPWPTILAAPVLVILCAYSLTKRFTNLAHLLLGAAIAFAPVGAWIAIAPTTLGWPAWLLLAAVTFWIAGFDIIYACQDADFDLQTGLHSLPAQLGIGPALRLARGCHVLTIAALVALGPAADLGLLYFVGVGCVAALLVIENALVHPHDLSRVNLAFFTINGIVGLLLGGLGVLDVCLRHGAAP